MAMADLKETMSLSACSSVRGWPSLIALESGEEEERIGGKKEVGGREDEEVIEGGRKEEGKRALVPWSRYGPPCPHGLAVALLDGSG